MVIRLMIGHGSNKEGHVSDTHVTVMLWLADAWRFVVYTRSICRCQLPAVRHLLASCAALENRKSKKVPGRAR